MENKELQMEKDKLFVEESTLSPEREKEMLIKPEVAMAKNASLEEEVANLCQ